MFQMLRKHSRILVTGPMRSGTTICAAMIERDAGKRLVREEQMFEVWPNEMNVVVQAPVLLGEIRRLGLGGWYVIVMERNPEEIKASMQKFMKDKLSPFQIDKLAEQQIDQAREAILWLHDQNTGLQVNYDQLRSHPMWVEDRKGFGPRDIAYSTDRTLRTA